MFNVKHSQGRRVRRLVTAISLVAISGGAFGVFSTNSALASGYPPCERVTRSHHLVQGPCPSPTTIGRPIFSARYWTHQHTQNGCGPASIADVLDSTHYNVTPHTVISWATRHGYLSPNGMTAQNIVDTINNGSTDHAAIYHGGRNLVTALRNGETPIVLIDAERIWFDKPDPNVLDHAVVVTGYDPTTRTVYLNDSGVVFGREEAIPVAEFDHAWSASNFELIYVTR